MVTGSPSIAIQVYSSEDIHTFEEDGLSNANSALDWVDALQIFWDLFQHSILFFILHSEQQQQDQLSWRVLKLTWINNHRLSLDQ